MLGKNLCLKPMLSAQWFESQRSQIKGNGTKKNSNVSVQVYERMRSDQTPAEIATEETLKKKETTNATLYKYNFGSGKIFYISNKSNQVYLKVSDYLHMHEIMKCLSCLEGNYYNLASIWLMCCQAKLDRLKEVKKIDFIMSNPKACVTIIEDFGSEPICDHSYRSLIIRGNMPLVKTPEETDYAIRLLIR